MEAQAFPISKRIDILILDENPRKIRLQEIKKSQHIDLTMRDWRAFVKDYYTIYLYCKTLSGLPKNHSDLPDNFSSEEMRINFENFIKHRFKGFDVIVDKKCILLRNKSNEQCQIKMDICDLRALQNVKTKISKEIQRLQREKKKNERIMKASQSDEEYVNPE